MFDKGFLFKLYFKVYIFQYVKIINRVLCDFVGYVCYESVYIFIWQIMVFKGVELYINVIYCDRCIYFNE